MLVLMFTWALKNRKCSVWARLKRIKAQNTFCTTRSAQKKSKTCKIHISFQSNKDSRVNHETCLRHKKKDCGVLSHTSGNKRWWMGSLLACFQFEPNSVLSFSLFKVAFSLCVFLSTMAVLEPFSQIKKCTCLVSRRLFYIYVSYFYIFFYGYLLHIVVYITVVWIDTIIYFSMKNNLKTNRKSPNVVLGAEVCFKKKRNMYSVNMTSVLS